MSDDESGIEVLVDGLWLSGVTDNQDKAMISLSAGWCSAVIVPCRGRIVGVFLWASRVSGAGPAMLAFGDDTHISWHWSAVGFGGVRLWGEAATSSEARVAAEAATKRLLASD